MFRIHHRRLAWIFTLVLVLELALLCCASVRLTDHGCGGHPDCAICAFVRTGLRRNAVVAMMASALMAVMAVHFRQRFSRSFAIADSPILRRVRLND